MEIKQAGATDPGPGRAPGKVAAVVLAIALAATSAAVLGAKSPKPPAGKAGRKAAPVVQRLTAKALAAIDLGSAAPSDWSEPEVLEARDHVLNLDLRVAYADHEILVDGEVKKVHLRSYNGGLTGPTLRLEAGDTLNVTLRNELPVEPPMPPMVMDGKCSFPHDGFNITNLHTHGLHISPKGISDNVLRVIKPGDGPQGFKFELLPAGAPPGHPGRQYPGTFWYHAHNHGSTAMQLASGMAGALIVKDGPKDLVPEVAAARERLFLLQQFAFDASGRTEDFKTLRANWSTYLKGRTAINGRFKPRLTLRRGEVERWRFIDSGLFADLPISIVSTDAAGRFEAYRIAIDGITRPKPEPVSQIELGPGYRVDLLVKAPAAKGTYYLYKGKSTLFSLAGVRGAPALSDPQILAQIDVIDEVCTPPCATRIPAALRPPDDMLPTITREELTRPDPTVVKFELTPDGEFFIVNGSCFDIDKVLPELSKKLGDVEQWEVRNYTTIAHPFHIHVNAFQLLEDDGKPGAWHDTIMVPPKTGATPGVVRFRTRFERFDGKFVLHCHILPHEDEGMMQLVEIKP